MTILQYIVLVVFIAIGFFLGAFGWAQIIGSIRTRQHHFIIPILVWTVILGAATFAVWKWLNAYFVAYLIGIGISFFVMNGQKNIE